MTRNKQGKKNHNQTNEVTARFHGHGGTQKRGAIVAITISQSLVMKVRLTVVPSISIAISILSVR